MSRFLSATLAATALATLAFAQDPAKQQLQEKLAAVKQPMPANPANLRQSAWTETTQISLKGEVKKTDQKQCLYGNDGKVQKTPIAGAPPPPPKADSGRGGRRGGGKLKQEIVENKVDDMKEYMGKVAALVHQYVPPDPQKMQAAFQSGKATLDKATGTLTFNDYNLPGDKLTLAFDPAAKKLTSVNVASYLDKKDDAVTLVATFASLADGTSYNSQSVLDAKAKQIQVKITNASHRKAGQ